MFRRIVPFAALSLSVLMVASVAWAAPTSALSVSLSTSDVAVDFEIVGGQVESVVASARCTNGNVESWTSAVVTSSTVELGKGPRSSRVGAVAQAVHVDCYGTSVESSVNIRARYDENGRVDRSRDRATGTRTLTVPIVGTVTLPNDVVPDANGLQVETIGR